MSRPSKRTSPSTRAPGTVSCIRFRHRKSVDLPQPDGPMIAVTSPARTSNETSRTTRLAPKYASSASATSVSDGEVAAMRTSSGALTVIATSRSCTSPGSIRGETESISSDEPRREADDEDEPDEDEGPRPRLGVPIIEWRDRIVVDLRRKGGDRLEGRHRPELIAECGEQEWRRFAGDARHRHERPGHDPRQGGAQHHAERRPPLGIAERQRRLAHRHRYESNHLLGRTRDQRNRHRRERHPSGERREMLERTHQQLPGEDSE